VEEMMDVALVLTVEVVAVEDLHLSLLEELVYLQTIQDTDI
jgi:hypothetical protein